MKKGFTLIELLIVVAIIAILAAIAVPNFLEAQTRSKVARVKADHRSLATAIESYYVDNNQYPAFHGGSDASSRPTDSANVLGSNTNDVTFLENSRTFALRGGTAVQTITTPISFITSIPADPFADARGLPFRYYSTPRGFILGSFGPDADQSTSGEGDIGWANGTYVIGPTLDNGVESVYNLIDSNYRNVLIGGISALTSFSHTYDTSNGTISPGDVWRIRD